MKTKPPTPEEAAALELWAALHRTSCLLRGQMRPLFATWDLSGAQCHVLRMLAQADGEALTLSQISERLLVSNGNTTGIVDKLEEAGLVQRVPHPADRRAILLQLTPAGATLSAEIHPVFRRRVTELLGALTPAEKQQLGALLGKLHGSLAETCRSGDASG